MLLVAQRKLESIRVLDDVLERVKVIVVSPFAESSPLTQLYGKLVLRETPFSGSRSSSVDAGVGTDPLITNQDSLVCSVADDDAFNSHLLDYLNQIPNLRICTSTGGHPADAVVAEDCPPHVNLSGQVETVSKRWHPLARPLPALPALSPFSRCHRFDSLSTALSLLRARPTDRPSWKELPGATLWRENPGKRLGIMHRGILRHAASTDTSAKW